jgi:Nicotinamide mononucleotide transporter
VKSYNFRRQRLGQQLCGDPLALLVQLGRTRTQYDRIALAFRDGVHKPADFAIEFAASLLLAVAIARVLAAETQAAWPHLDASTMVLSLFATWLTARGKLENWLYWIVVDVVQLGCTPLRDWFSRRFCSWSIS